MWIKLDNLHYNFKRVDSYNKPFNLVISARCGGKSSALYRKMYKAFKKYHKPTIMLKRKIVDITEAYVEDIGTSINKFLPKKQQIKLEFKKGDIKEGICNVYINKRLFIRFIALSIPMSRPKSMIIRNPAFMVFDEYIVNVRAGEKYDPNEWFKILEIYRTYSRECKDYTLKLYFCGNPYSAFSPMVSALGVDMSLMKPGSFIIGNNYIVDCYDICDELKEKLKNDPTADFDEYSRYSFSGEAINDQNILLQQKQPEGYKLKWVFNINHKYLGIYVDTNTKNSNTIGYDCGRYWISIIDYVGANRKIFAVDFDNLVNGSQLITTDMKALCYRLKYSIARRDVTYKSIEEAYLTESIYTLI